MSHNVSADQARLDAAHAKGPLATLGVFLRLSGPGFLQSALTLGGGSLAAALFLGVIGGYSMLWVQLVGIVLGAIMLAAISYVTLTLERSPFEGMRRDINPFLAWSWLLAAIFVNMIFGLPQYALAYAAITENLFPALFPNPDDLGVKIIVTLILGIPVTLLTMRAGGGSKSERVYENALKVLVAIIVLCFAGVVVRLAFVGQLPLGEILAGFIPKPSHLFAPAGRLPEVIAQIDSPAARDWWSSLIVDAQRERMIGTASAAVGINMAFLMPFALLARGWNRSFRGLSLFDLGFGLIIPFVLATGSVMIASASQFHAQEWSGAEITAEGEVVMLEGASQSSFDELQGQLNARAEALPGEPVGVAEKRLASMLVSRTNKEFASALQTLFGESAVAQWIFGIGVIAMGLSTISLLVHISGIALCEATSSPHSSKLYRYGALFPVFGFFWPFLWGGASRAYLGVLAGVVGYSLLPLALLSFLFMLNSRRLLGDRMPTGRVRLTWNVIVGLALAITGSASIWSSWNLNLRNGFPAGKVFLVIAIVGTLWGAWHVHSKHRNRTDTSGS
ncbi:MAG: hypothetical protein ACFB21_15160 [Opitutales bacterium]